MRVLLPRRDGGSVLLRCLMLGTGGWVWLGGRVLTGYERRVMTNLFEIGRVACLLVNKYVCNN